MLPTPRGRLLVLCSLQLDRIRRKRRRKSVLLERLKLRMALRTPLPIHIALETHPNTFQHHSHVDEWWCPR